MWYKPCLKLFVLAWMLVTIEAISSKGRLQCGLWVLPNTIFLNYFLSESEIGVTQNYNSMALIRTEMVLIRSYPSSTTVPFKEWLPRTELYTYKLSTFRLTFISLRLECVEWFARLEFQKRKECLIRAKELILNIFYVCSLQLLLIINATFIKRIITFISLFNCHWSFWRNAVITQMFSYIYAVMGTKLIHTKTRENKSLHSKARSQKMLIG